MYVKTLANLAGVLARVGGRLLIFGPLTPEMARKTGLEGHNVVLGGFVKSNELKLRLREEADTLFVPMSFDPAEATNMGMGFPSKLTEYTAVGLPLLIYEPEYCSAVRWARENVGVGEVVTEESGTALSDAVIRLGTKPAVRIEFGRRALEVGERYFAWGSARSILETALQTWRTR